MKVIFLDFDGVIRTTRSRLAALTADGFDPVAGRLISTIATQATAKLVVSSAWRDGRTQPEIAALLSQAEIETALLHRDWSTPVLGQPRREEIDAWLNLHADVSHHAAIDDGIGFDPKDATLVLTEMDEGFGFSHVLSVAKILGCDILPWLDGMQIKLTSAEKVILSTLNRQKAAHSDPKI